MSTQSVRCYTWGDVESLPRPDMEKLQVERLRAGIDRVSKAVPFYKKKLADAGVTAELPWLRWTIKNPWPLIAKNASPIFQLEAPVPEERRRNERIGDN
jgi:hypothetical protein